MHLLNFGLVLTVKQEEEILPKQLCNALAIFLVTVTHVFVAHGQQLSNNDTSHGTESSETRYVSDKLITYLHSGPGRNFRIIGSVEAGTPVTQLLTQSENNFVQVIDDKNRTGWLDARHVVSQKTVHVQLPILREQLSFSAAQLTAKQVQIDELMAEITSLESNGQALQAELAQLNQQISQMQAALASQHSEQDQAWFLLGGGVGLGGVLLGVIVSLMLKGRRRSETWM